MPDANGYTKTEARIMLKLDTGRLCPRDDLAKLLGDCSNDNNLQVTISHLRTKLRKKGQDIACGIVNRVWYYQLLSIDDPRLADISERFNSI